MELSLVTVPAGDTQDAPIGPQETQERIPARLEATVQSEEDGAESASGPAPAVEPIAEVRILGTARWRQLVNFLSPLRCHSERPATKRNPWIGAVVAESSSDSTAHGDSDSSHSSEPVVGQPTSSDGTTSEDAYTPPVDGALSRRHNAARVKIHPAEDGIEGTGTPSNIERDVEEATTSSSASVPAEAAVAKTAAVEPGLVLPCAPSDDEKVLYFKTGRSVMLAFGCVSFCTVLVGMTMFSVMSPYLYWFGAPTAIALVTALLHYSLVTAWGDDFDEEGHAEIVKTMIFPTVDIFLPVCNEPLAVVQNTWKHIAALDYQNFTVHVLDDGQKDEVRDLAAGYGFNYIRRDDRPLLKKAGNLRYAFARTSGELIVVFDADFCPRPDFLHETLPYFADPAIGLVQTPQYFRRSDAQTWVEQGAGVVQELFYRLIQASMDRFNAAVCAGSCGIYRRKAVEPFGGVAPVEHSEDMYSGVKITELGYKIKYVPLCLAMGTCPDTPRSLFMQQYRWCMGTLTLVTSGKDFIHADVPILYVSNWSIVWHKVFFIAGLFSYISSALFIFVGPLPIILLVWLEAHRVLWYYAGFAVPSLIYIVIVIPLWSRQDNIHRAMPSHRVRILKSYAHIYAIKDRIMGTVAPWVPSGGGASASSSNAYKSSVRLLIVWSIGSAVFIVGGATWRMTMYPWYHFVSAVVFAVVGCGLSLSTLWY